MEDFFYRHLGWFFAALLVAVLGGVVWLTIAIGNDAEDGCTAICETNGSHKREVTSFGCLCEDGTVYQRNPQHTTTVVPVAHP